MAEYLEARRGYLILLLALGLARPGLAEEIIDPTRPPQAAMQQLPAADGSAVQIDIGPVLQSVMISKKRKLAVISGQEIALGGMLGESKLVAVRDHEVDLRNPDGTLQTLPMYAGVTKTVIEVKKKAPVKTGGVKQP